MKAFTPKEIRELGEIGGATLMIDPADLVLDAQSAVTGFVRPGASASGSFHFVGVQAAEPSAFDDVQLDVPANSIGGAYDRLLARRPGAVRGFVTSGTFWDVGTIADYRSTSSALAGSARSIGRNARIHPTSRVDTSILWDDVAIGAGAIENTSILSAMYGVDVQLLQVKIAEGALYPTIVVQADAQLAQVAAAEHTVRRFSDLLNSGQEERHHDSDNGDDHEQLNQGESAAA